MLNRLLAASLVLVVLCTAPSADAHLPWRKGRSLPPPPPVPLTITCTTGGTDFARKPEARPRELWRTPLVAQGEDVINVQTEVLVPWSPQMTSAVIGGTDASKLEQSGDCKVALTAAARAAIGSAGAQLTWTVTPSNAYGTGPTATVTENVVADTNARFVSFGSGSDSNNGTTPALAWKHVPRNWDFTGSQVTLGAGKVLFFKAELYRTRLATTNSISGTTPLPHSGTSGNPFVYSGTGWLPAGSAYERATIDGTELVTGSGPPTQLEVDGNPNYASLTKFDLTSQGGAGGYWLSLFAGSSMLYVSQWPTPDDITKSDDPFDDGAGGWWRLTNSSSGTGPRMYTASNVVHIFDPRICTRYGNVPVSGLPPKVLIWGPNNESTFLDITTYNYDAGGTNCELQISGVVGPLVNNNGKTAYALIGGKIDVVKVGQFAITADGLTYYAWLPNAGETSIARRESIINASVSYVTYSGLAVQRSASNSVSLFGSAFTAFSSISVSQLTFSDIWCSQNRQDTGSGGCIHSSNTNMADSIVERFKLHENPRSSGFRMGGGFDGLTSNTTPTADEVIAYSKGKMRWNYCEENCAGRTIFAIFKSVGAEYTENVIRNLNGLHGNVFSPYGVDDAVHRTVFDKNWVEDSTRPLTASIQGTGAPTKCRYNTYLNNLFTGGFQDQAASLNSTEPCGVFQRNIFMWGPSTTYTGYAINLTVGNSVVFTHNVIAGASNSTVSGVDNVTAMSPFTYAYDIENNLFTINKIPNNNGSLQIQLSNTVATGAPIRVWDGTFTNEMKAALGSGPIGPFVDSVVP